MRAVLDAQKRTDTFEDIAALRGLLDRRDDARSAEDPSASHALAQQLAEAEGRIAGYIDHLAKRIRPVTATPQALNDLAAAVGTLEEAVRAQTQATEAKTSFLDQTTGARRILALPCRRSQIMTPGPPPGASCC